MKRILSILLVMVMLLSMAPANLVFASASANEFAGGSGTAETPYLISNKTHLNNVRNYASAHFKMIANIVFLDSDFQSGGDFYNNGQGWDPIGSGSNVIFSGVFDGNGHTISNLRMKRSAEYVGLFGYNQGTIKNLGLIGANISASSPQHNYHVRVGGIAGAGRLGTIENCYNMGGTVAASSAFSNRFYVGGIVGEAVKDTIAYCYNTGKVSAVIRGYDTETFSYAGGIAGGSDYSTIQYCYNTGEVYAEAETVATAPQRQVGALAYAGGISTETYDGIIKNCYNTGEITAKSMSDSVEGGIDFVYAYAGGIAGRSTAITNCYNIGNAAATVGSRNYREPEDVFRAYVGGVAGMGQTITNAYYADTMPSGSGNEASTSVQCTSTELKQQSTFAGFDFENVWTMDGHACYPYPELKDVEFTSDHIYDNACDATCDCGQVRKIEHDYYPTYDELHHFDECVICGEAVNIQSHEFDHSCDAMCDCGYERSITHSYAPTFNTENHFDKCTICEAVTNVTAHQFESSCDTTCACGYVRMITHNYQPAFDANNHFERCIVCSDTINTAAHVYENSCDATCDCGYIRTVTHNYQGAFVADHHFLKCAVCGDIVGIGSHEFESNCDTTCECGYVREISHDYHLIFDAENHFEKCGVCGDVINAKAHVFEHGCDTTCDCGYTRTTTHQYQLNFNNFNHFDKCTVCGDIVNTAVHVYINACDPDCDCGYVRNITHRYDHACDTICNVCGAVRTITHVYVPAFNANNHFSRCWVCNDIIDASSHRFDNACDPDCDCGYTRTITHDYQPAFDAEGHFDKCTVCGDTINTLSHGFVNACDSTCNCGYVREITHDYKNIYNAVNHFEECTICGNIGFGEPHTFDNDCDTNCDCGYVRKTTHSYGQYVYNKDATTKKDGTKTRTCSVCGTKQTVTATGTKLQSKNPFTDVKKSDFYYEPVLWAVNNGITSGTGKTTFSPNEACTRGQIATFLWRAAGQPTPSTSKNPFTDVKKSDYYYKAVLWAVGAGITSGTSKTTFSPNDPCTRGQIAAFLWRANGGKKVNASNPFTDVKKSDYYYNAVLWAVKNGITAGATKTTFEPNSPCTRGQIATFLYRAYN